jgi:hypothetical protein
MIASVWSTAIAVIGAAGGPAVALFVVLSTSRNVRAARAETKAQLEAEAEIRRRETAHAVADRQRAEEIGLAVQAALDEALPHLIEKLNRANTKIDQVDLAVNGKEPGEESIGEGVAALRRTQQAGRPGQKTSPAPSIREQLQKVLDAMESNNNTS